MHILILTSTPRVADEIRTTLDGAAERCTVASTWPEAISALEDDPPDLILVERATLSREGQPSPLLRLAEPNLWPPLILIDTPSVDAASGVLLAKRLLKAVPPSYQIGDLCIDTRKKRAGLGDHWVNLPPLQYRLLLTMARRAGEVVSYRELLRAVWGYDGADNEARELLKVHIRQIRRRLGLDIDKNLYIRSVRGFGYMLAPPDEHDA
jgi:DNA-binding response OmpR family regulator